MPRSGGKSFAQTCRAVVKGEVLRRPFTDEASSLPDMSTVVIPESSAMYDGSAAGRQEPGVSVPSLALDKVPSLHGKASGTPAAGSQIMSQTSKPDSEAEAPAALGEASPRSDQLTSEQVAGLDGEAPALLKQDPELMLL